MEEEAFGKGGGIVGIEACCREADQGKRADGIAGSRLVGVGGRVILAGGKQEGACNGGDPVTAKRGKKTIDPGQK
jgi:hypothetical protein